MPDERDLILTSDTLLTAMGHTPLRRFVTSTQRQHELFELVCAYAREQHPDSVVSGSSADTGMDALPARVPGTPLHVRLSRVTTDEIRDFIGAAAVLAYTGSGDLDLPTLTVAAVLSVRDRVRRTRTELGERCVVDVVLELPHSTTSGIVAELFGRPCRYPRSSCRYMSVPRNCAADRESVDAIAAGLAKRTILVMEDAVHPPEYRVVR